MSPIEFMNRTYRDVLLISLAAYLVRSLEFLTIGSYAPGILVGTFALLIITGILTGGSWVRFVLKTWSVLLVLFGVLRYVLVLMLHITNVEEIHILEQFTFLFNLFNILSIGTGIWLFRATKRSLIFSGQLQEAR